MIPPPVVLTIAGSDSGGGAGIQADIQTIAANGGYAVCAITSITAQNTCGVKTAFELPAPVIEAQIKAVASDFTILAVKTGMLSSRKIVQTVARLIKKMAPSHWIVDPVMVSKNGYPLLKSDAISAMRTHLIPFASLVTPNIDEAEALSEIKIHSLEDVEKAAQVLHKLGCRAILIKGGHLQDHPGVDLFYDGSKKVLLKTTYIHSPHTHGTGCVYAAAIATQLALGKPMLSAIRKAKRYITRTIEHGLALGQGQGPVDPLYRLRQKGSWNESRRVTCDH